MFAKFIQPLLFASLCAAILSIIFYFSSNKRPIAPTKNMISILETINRFKEISSFSECKDTNRCVYSMQKCDSLMKIVIDYKDTNLFKQLLVIKKNLDSSTIYIRRNCEQLTSKKEPVQKTPLPPIRRDSSKKESKHKVDIPKIDIVGMNGAMLVTNNSKIIGISFLKDTLTLGWKCTIRDKGCLVYCNATLDGNSLSLLNGSTRYSQSDTSPSNYRNLYFYLPSASKKQLGLEFRRSGCGKDTLIQKFEILLTQKSTI